MEDFSDMLLQKLFTVAIKSCQDNDKVRSNAVRALGNLLRYLPNRSLGEYMYYKNDWLSYEFLYCFVKHKVVWAWVYELHNIFCQMSMLFKYGEKNLWSLEDTKWQMICVKYFSLLFHEIFKLKHMYV